MGTVIIFGVLLFVSMIALIAGFKMQHREDRHIGKMVSGAAFLIAFVVLGFGSYCIVPPGHRGVQVIWGNMNMTPIQEGFNWIDPRSDVDDYSVQMQRTVVEYLAVSADTQEVDIQFVFNWRADASSICTLIKDYTPNYSEVLFQAAMTESVKAEIAKYKVRDIVASRAKIKQDVQHSITEWLARYGITVEEGSISDIDFSESYNNAIESKQVQEQKAQEEENILRQVEIKAEQAKAQAAGKADAIIEDARGAAESIRVVAIAEAAAITVRADAQATANAKIAASLTKTLIERLYLESWDGVLPRFLMGSDGNGMSVILPPEVVDVK